MDNKAMKWIIIILAIVSVGIGIIYFTMDKDSNKNNNSNTLKELPKPEVTGGTRGQLGIDKNINEQNIDEYLNREDAVYRDMRMLEDPAQYESIGGDRYLSGYIKGFEIIPLPYIIPVEGLPSEVGETYKGDTLFSYVDNKYVANYEESMSIIEKIFPKDKVIFLMCGGGGYAGMTKNFLVALGWNEEKIYNVGGYWYYEGKNKVEVKKVVDNKVTYDFENVPYHKIEFDKLTKSKDYDNNHKVSVTGITINTKKVSVEEGSSYKLNVIVLPNEATNKNVKWTSSNEKIATVDNTGLVSTKSAGTVKINAITLDGNKSVSCEVTVTKKPNTNHVVLSDIKKEKKEFDAISYDTLTDKFNSKVYDKNFDLIVSEEEFTKEEELYKKEIKKHINEKTKIINSLIDNKKSFIILFSLTTCGANNTFRKKDSAKKILDNNKVDYINIAYGGEDGLKDSKLYSQLEYGNNVTFMTIIKNGKIYAYADESKYSFNNDKDVKNWLSKYIDIK